MAESTQEASFIATTAISFTVLICKPLFMKAKYSKKNNRDLLFEKGTAGTHNADVNLKSD